jgi:hypothetical protein
MESNRSHVCAVSYFWRKNQGFRKQRSNDSRLYHPVDVAANLYVLSANPYSACFFCGGAGPESVVQLKMKKTNKKYETDDVMKFKGVLKLNADDINEMNYILDAAELIEK